MLDAWLSVRFVDAPGVLLSDWMKIAVNPAVTSTADGTRPSSSRLRALNTTSSLAPLPALRSGPAATLQGGKRRRGAAPSHTRDECTCPPHGRRAAALPVARHVVPLRDRGRPDRGPERRRDAHHRDRLAGRTGPQVPAQERPYHDPPGPCERGRKLLGQTAELPRARLGPALRLQERRRTER